MKVKNNLLAASVRHALLLGLSGTALVALPAFAQDAEGDDAKETTRMETIEVNRTGTRIRSAAMETAAPVSVIGAEQIEKSGKLTIGDILQDTSFMAGAATNVSVNNGGGDGAARVSLRGLGEVRTLLLLNGRRVVLQDVNAMPAAIIDRIDILKEGASAVYGSDAVGGVVNIVTKSDFDGAKVSVDYGISDQDDGQRVGGNFTWGGATERGNVMLNLNYNQQDAVSAADRDFSRLALTLYSGEVVVGGSSRTTTGRYAVPRALAVSNGITCGGTSATVALTRIDGRPGTSFSDFRCFNNATDLFNYQAVGNYELTPTERAGLFVTSNYNLTDSIGLYTQFRTQSTSSNGQIAPLPFDGRASNDNVVLSANSIYNPFGTDITDGRLRLSRIGNRRYSYSTDLKEATLGARGFFGESSWSWDVNYTWGKYDQTLLSTGYLFSAGLQAALGPSFIDAGGAARCGVPGAIIAGCTPVDFFGAPPDPSTPAGQAQLEALAGISPNATNDTSRRLRTFSGAFAGDLFELPAGAVAAAVGFDYRQEDFAFDPDALAVINTDNFTCNISSEACTDFTAGDDSVKELYAEAYVPLLTDASFAKSLALTVGTRWSDYQDAGSTTNSKLGLEWRPTDGILVRGTLAEVFRAPNITERFQGLSAFSASFTDPCNGYTGGNAVACENVPTDGSFNQTDSQVSAFLQGNSALKPEEGHVATWGVVYDPEWLEGFSTSVDVWRYQMKKVIAAFGTQNILDACFVDPNSPFCGPDFWDGRDENGEIIRVFDFNANVGEWDTNGFDFGAAYAFETGIGNFRSTLDMTYVNEFNTRNVVNGVAGPRSSLEGTFLSSANGGLGNYSRWRGFATMGWNLGAWQANWRTRYVHGFEVRNADAGIPGVVLERGATTYHNLQVGYNLEAWNTKFQLGIDNLFDKQPPILYQNNTLNGNTDERTFDTVGRYFWVNAAVEF
jgi:iron complex outermembrane recepter protein